MTRGSRTGTSDRKVDREKENRTVSVQKTPCNKHQNVREYTFFQEFLDNLPYILMVLLGSSVFLFGFHFSFPGFALAIFYILYGVAGAIWIMLFLCPYCHFNGTRPCPCGYGKIAEKWRPKSGENRFSEKFQKQIPIIVPLWIIPSAFGTVFLITDYTLTMLVLMILFTLDAFLVLPLVARFYGCGHCPQKDDCPWMVHK